MAFKYSSAADFSKNKINPDNWVVNSQKLFGSISNQGVGVGRFLCNFAGYMVGSLKPDCWRKGTLISNLFLPEFVEETNEPKREMNNWQSNEACTSEGGGGAGPRLAVLWVRTHLIGWL